MATEVGSIFVRASLHDADFHNGLNRMQSGLKSGVAGLARLGAVAAGAAAGGLGVAVVKAAEFDRGMRNVNTIAKLSETQLKAVSKQALALAGPTGQAPKVLVAGLYDLVSSGFKANDAIKILNVSARAATAGMTTAAVATKAVTASLNAYHLGADSARKVSDILFTTVKLGVLTFDELAQNMGDLVPAAAPLGISLEEVGAAMSTITLQGVPAAEAATRVKNVMLQLAKPSEALGALFKKQGYESGEAAIKGLGFAGVLGLINDATKGSVTETAKLTPEIRSLMGLVGLTGKNMKTYNEHLRQHKEAMRGAGASAEAFAEQSKSVSVQWDKAKASLSVIAITLGSQLLPALSGAVRALSAFFTKFTEAKGFTAKFKVVFEGVKDAAQSLAEQFSKYFITGWTDVMKVESGGGRVLKTFHQGLLGQLQGLDWAAIGQSILDGIVNGLKDAARIGKRLLAVIESAMAGVDWSAVGIKLGPALAGAVAAAFVTLMDPVWWAQHWELALAIGLAFFGKGLGKFAAPIGNALKGLVTRAFDDVGLAIAGAVERLSPRLASALLSMFTRAGEGLGAAGAALASAVGRAVEGAFAAIRNLGGRLGGVLAFTVKVLGIEAAIRAIEGFVGDAIGAVGRAGRAIGHALADGFRVAIEAMKRVGLEAALAVIEPFSHIPKQGGAWARRMKDSIQGELTNMKFDQIGRNADRDLAQLPPIARKHAAAGGKAFTDALASGTTPALAALKASAGAAAQGAGDEFGKHSGKAKAGGEAIGKGAAEGVGKGAVQMGAKARTEAAKVGPIVGGFAGAAFTGGFSTGTSAGQGVAAGIRSQIGAIAAAAAAASAASVITMQKTIKAHSRSQETYDKVGIPLAQGLIEGFKAYLIANGTEIAEATKKALKMATQVGPAFQSAAKALGLGHAKAIVAGFLQGSPEIGAQISQALRDATKIAELATQAAKTIGRKQAQAIVEGFKEKEPGIVEQHRIAFKQAEAIKGVIEENAKVLGRGHAQAIARGITEGSPGIVTQVRLAMAEAKKAMRDAAAEAVRDARGALDSGFSNLASSALAAFDKVASGFKSEFRVEIEGMQLDDQIKQLADGVTKAQEALAKASGGGDPEAIKSAQESLYQALRAQQIFNLEQLAKADEEQHTKDTEKKRIRFEARLNQLKTALAAEAQALAKAKVAGDPGAIAEAKAAIAETQRELKAALNANIPGYAQSGSSIGAELAKGIRSAIGEVVKAVREMARAIQKRLKLKSPAEEGELSDIDTWWSSLPAMLVASLDLAPIKGAGGRIAAALRGGIDESIGTGNPLEKFSASLNTSFGTLKTTFSGLEEAVRPATATLAVFAEPMATLAGASESAASSVSTATSKISKLPPMLTSVGTTATLLEPILIKSLKDPINAIAGEADQARDQINGMRAALEDLDGTTAHTYLTNHITNIVDNVASGETTSGSGSTGSGGGGGGKKPRPGGGRPFATGGIVTKPTLAMIGERGPEAVIPLSKGGGYGVNGGGGGPQKVVLDVTLVLDKQVLGRFTHEELIRRGRQGPLSLPA